jgi:hypothetical protein
MTKLINKLLYFAQGIAEQVSLVDPDALLKVTAIETKSIEATDGTQTATLAKLGLSLTDALGADLQTLNHAVLKNLIVLQGIGSDRAATFAELQTEVDARTLRDTQLTGYINDEVDRASGAESDLRGLITQESLDRAAADTQIRSDFADVDTAIRGEFAAADLILDGDISQERTDRTTQYGNVNQAILDEAFRATGAEGVISGNVSTLSIAMTTDEGNLVDAQGALADEITARGLQYNEINGAIGAEVTRATGVEADLQNQINALPSKLEWQDSVLSEVAFASLPASPAVGARYLVISGTNANSIAQWNGSAYVFTTPTLGMFVTIDDQANSIKYYNGSAWVAKVWENYEVGAGLNLTGNVMKVANLGVVEAMLADGAVTGAKIADSAVDGVTIEKAAGAGVESLLISQDSFNDTATFTVGGSRLAQVFTVFADSQMSKISLYGTCEDIAGATADVIIRPVVAGVIQDTVIAQVLINTVQDPDTTFSWHDAVFAAPVSLVAGQSYAVEVISHTFGFNCRADSTDLYLGGDIHYYSGGAWHSGYAGGGFDLTFRVYSVVLGAPALAVKDSGVSAAKLAANSITDAKVSPTAAIQMSKIDGLDAALTNAQSSATSVVIPGSLGLAARGDVMYQTSTNALRALASDVASCRSLLGAYDSLTGADEDRILIVGKTNIPAVSGYTPAAGDVLYLSDTYQGKVTNVAPTTIGHCVVEAGIAVNDAEMIVKPAFKYKIV